MRDLISRQDVIKAIEDLPNAYNGFSDSYDKSCIIDVLEALPFAETEEFEWCHDCKEYDQEAHCCHRWTKVIRNTVEELKAEQRKGKWIEDDDSTVRGHCSVCGWESHYYEDDVIGMPFCPNCGARMESESERWAELGKAFAEGLYKGLT